MLKWNIRNQILAAGGVSLLVIVGVIANFYNFSKNEFRSSSRELIQMTSAQSANEINRSFAAMSRVFGEWTKDDVFGMAIEFNTTEELRQQFDRWLGSSTGFSLVVLVDERGTVLEAAGAAPLSDAVTSLPGRSLPEVNFVTDKNTAQTVYAKSKTLTDLGLDQSDCYLFYYPAHNLSGKSNGGLLAFSDWSIIDAHTQECMSALAERGYAEARVMLAYPNGVTGPASYASKAAGSLNQSDYDVVSGWISAAVDNTVTSKNLADETVLVGVNKVASPTLTTDERGASSGPVFLTIVQESEVMAKLNEALVVVLLIGVIGVLVVLGINYFIARRIASRITRGAAVAKGMAAGDADQEIDIRGNDELGELGAAFRDLAVYFKDMSQAAGRIAERDLTIVVEPRSDRDVLGIAFKTMTTNLTGMVRQLTDNAGQLVSAAGEISSSSDEMSRGANEQTQQMSQISAAIEEMAATIVESSRNAGDATDASNSAAGNAVEGGKVVAETIQGMQRISTVVRRSADSISKLATSADQIGEIVSVIDDIADQTNLLALNAAIEAARAGEQGRGFAVVADEVRKLAERTGSATREITEMIKGIQTETQEAVEAMETGTSEVDNGRELADKAGMSLNEIVQVSQQVMDMIRQIAVATDEQSAAAEQISKNVEQVSAITRETATGAEQSAKAAEELNRQAEDMQEMVRQFKVEYQNR